MSAPKMSSRRTLSEAFDKAEELADWFEREGPPPENARPASEFYIGLLAEARSLHGNHSSEVLDVVAWARRAGASWDQIGEVLEVSGAEAEHSFG